MTLSTVLPCMDTKCTSDPSAPPAIIQSRQKALTVLELAELLSLCPKQVSALIRRGSLPHNPHFANERGKKVKTKPTSPNISLNTINSDRVQLEHSIGSQSRTPSQANGSNIHRKPRPHFTCLIHLFLTHYPPSADSAREPKHVSNPVWSGRSWDAAGVLIPSQPLTTSVVFGIDDTPASRDAIITDLQLHAIERGYTHCEVRDFSTGQSGYYIPLYGGPLPISRGVSSTTSTL